MAGGAAHALRVTADRPEMLQAVESRAKRSSQDVVTLLRWPTEPHGEARAGPASRRCCPRTSGWPIWDAVATARADGLIAHAQVLARADVVARPAGRDRPPGRTPNGGVAWLDATDWVLDATGGIE